MRTQQINHSACRTDSEKGIKQIILFFFHNVLPDENRVNWFTCIYYSPVWMKHVLFWKPNFTIDLHNYIM